jgi:hypothetical protein
MPTCSVGWTKAAIAATGLIATIIQTEHLVSVGVLIAEMVTAAGTGGVAIMDMEMDTTAWVTTVGTAASIDVSA